ncbi:hypothetical protein RCQ27_006795, partial [Pseudomonas aeruginosa]|nr:hypothetical protein [Pseudomonas aeruginosa]ELL1264313.1 hypothetical protein [Pseudomonas aeruginosa]
KELSDRFNLIANQWGGTLAGIQPWATAPTPAQARNSLELRSAAQADIGTTLGNAMPVGAFGIGSERPDRAPSIHRYATSVEIFDSTTVDSVATGISNGSVLTIGYDGSDLRGAQMFFGQVPASTVKGRCGKFSSAPIFEFYTTINTTRATDGTLRAASPVVRIANVDGSLRPDLNELDFEPAGAWGVANAEARGVTVQRLAVGVYKVSGSLGLAKEGW